MQLLEHVFVATPHALTSVICYTWAPECYVEIYPFLISNRFRQVWTCFYLDLHFVVLIYCTLGTYYRLPHIEICDCKWFWGVEGSIFCWFSFESIFRSNGHLSFIHWFSYKWHSLSSTARRFLLKISILEFPSMFSRLPNKIHKFKIKYSKSSVVIWES